MTEIFGFTPQDLGLTGLVGLCVLLILTGRLVPRRTVEDLRAEVTALSTRNDVLLNLVLRTQYQTSATLHQALGEVDPNEALLREQQANPAVEGDPLALVRQLLQAQQNPNPAPAPPPATGEEAS